jgi:hypothetical protein
MEANGIPIDVDTLSMLRPNTKTIQEQLIRQFDGGYGIYEGRSFRSHRFVEYLRRQRIPWPRLSNGRPSLTDATFKKMSQLYPVVAPIRRIRDELSKFRLAEIEVGLDGRNRVSLWPFQTKTGRNAPSNSHYVFGTASWLRSLVRPAPGRALIFCDWAMQEHGIAAILSRDGAMLQAYQTGDPYLEFGRQSGLIPVDGTKQTHKVERAQAKSCVLGTAYGMEAKSLAARIEKPLAYAQHLLDLHHATYPRFWRWSDSAEALAILTGQIQTVFGWTLHVTRDANPRSLRNFPCQGNGAEMMRLASCLATEQGLQIIAPVHDALVAESAASAVDETAAALQECMARASEAVLDGFRLRSDVEIVRHPDHFQDERGVDLWSRVMSILEGLKADSA